MLLLPAKRKVSASPAIHPKMMIASSPQNTNIKTPTLSHQDEPTLPFYGTNSVQRSQMDGEASQRAHVTEQNIHPWQIRPKIRAAQPLCLSLDPLKPYNRRRPPRIAVVEVALRCRLAKQLLFTQVRLGNWFGRINKNAEQVNRTFSEKSTGRCGVDCMGSRIY